METISNNSHQPTHPHFQPAHQSRLALLRSRVRRARQHSHNKSYRQDQQADCLMECFGEEAVSDATPLTEADREAEAAMEQYINELLAPLEQITGKKVRFAT